MLGRRAATPRGVAMKFEAGVVRAVVDLRCYRLSAVKKAAYRVARSCTVVLGATDAATDADDADPPELPAPALLPLTFRFRGEVSEAAALAAARTFFDELTDQELREQTAEETAPLRALILASAFSRVELLQRQDERPGDGEP